MTSAQKPLRYIVPSLIVVGLITLAVWAGGPELARSAITVPGSPQLRMFLRIEGIEGERTDELHEGAIEVLAYEQEPISLLDRPTIEDGSAGMRILRLTVTKPISRVTPVLMLHCCRQTPIRTVTLELWLEDAVSARKVMVYTGHDCLISTVRNLRGLTAGSPATEELTFLCAGMEWTHTEYDAVGRTTSDVEARWDTWPRD